MRIRCVYCGERGNEEFTYLGDATLVRPSGGGDQVQRWHDYVHLRDNPAGAHRELWQHVGGCRSWLVVTRNVSTHEIIAVEAAHAVALARPSSSDMGSRI